MSFISKWQQAVERKQSLLCVGIDPANQGQRENQALDQGLDKLSWTLNMIEAVAPFAAGIKLNRNYFKDCDSDQLLKLTGAIHSFDMISIDDSKVADIGDSNDAGIYHAKAQGFDAITYAPFPGNIADTAKRACQRDIGLIMLVMMSNPEFQMMAKASIDGKPFSNYLAEAVAQHDIEGMVIGAPSPSNHIDTETIKHLDKLSGGNKLALVPGVGAQGGSAATIVEVFGPRAIINVGRSITYAENPSEAARKYLEGLGV